MGFYRHKVECRPSEDETSHHQNNNKELSNLDLSSVNVSIHFFTAHIITDISEIHLHVIEYGNINQCVLNQWLYFQKYSCQSCLHLAICAHPTSARE